MPIINVKMYSGRTVDEKRDLVKRMTEATMEAIKCPADAVKIMIEEFERENWANAGVLRVDEK